jgi:hypothetical protein
MMIFWILVVVAFIIIPGICGYLQWRYEKKPGYRGGDE